MGAKPDLTEPIEEIIVRLRTWADAVATELATSYELSNLLRSNNERALAKIDELEQRLGLNEPKGLK